MPSCGYTRFITAEKKILMTNDYEENLKMKSLFLHRPRIYLPTLIISGPTYPGYTKLPALGYKVQCIIMSSQMPFGQPELQVFCWAQHFIPEVWKILHTSSAECTEFCRSPVENIPKGNDWCAFYMLIAW